MMNPEVKAAWVAALRSGKYQQGKNYLALEGKFCCLGVLCELALKHGIITTHFNSENGTGYYEGKHSSLPNSVSAWLGVDKEIESVMVFDEDGDEQDVINLNDSKGYTFAMIADAIERTPND